MKKEQRKQISFKGQRIFIGIDVHLKSWSVTIASEHAVLKRFTQSPSPEALHSFLTREYPDAEYKSVYEAGFCGFWIHERLMELGRKWVHQTLLLRNGSLNWRTVAP